MALPSGLPQALSQPLLQESTTVPKSLPDKSCDSDLEASSVSTEAPSSVASDSSSLISDSSVSISSHLIASVVDSATSPAKLWDVDKPRAVRALVCCSLCVASVSFWESTFTIFEEHLSDSFHMSGVATNFAFGIEIITLALVAPICVMISERVGFRMLLLMALMCTVAASIGLASVSGAMTLYCCYFLAGVSVGCTFVPSINEAVRLTPPEIHAIVGSTTASAYLAGGMAWVLAVRSVIEMLNFRGAYLVCGLSASCAQGFCLILFPSLPSCTRTSIRDDKGSLDVSSMTFNVDAHTPNQDRLPNLLVNDIMVGRLVLTYSGMYLITCVYVFMESQMQDIAENMMPLSAFLNLAVPIYSAFSLIGRLSWGPLATKFSSRSCLAAGFCFAALGAFVWGYAAQWPVIQLCCIALVAVGTNAHLSLLPAILTEVYGSRGALVLGILFTSDVLTGLSVAPLAAVGEAISWQWMMLILSAMVVTGALTMMAGLR